MAKRFDRQLDKATDSTLIDPNWDAIIECVDMIRGGEAPVKAAIASIRKRYHNENPHVAHHALLVLEACMKNCGPKFHAEIATKEFMEDLKNLSLDATPDKVKNKILELLQCWAIAFKNKPEYKIVVDTHNLMKLAGFEFPEVAEADAMFVAESAPEWAEGDECFRCRTVFGLITRKHHCRACGQIFCDKCSNKTSYLPQYGIEKPVRVCDGCYEKSSSAKMKSVSQESTTSTSSVRSTSSVSSVRSTSTSASSSSSKSEKQLPVDAKKTAEQRARELKQAEEDELNLALAISQSEAEAQEQDRQRRMYQLYNGTDNFGESSVTNGGSPSNESSIYKGVASSKEDSTTRDTTLVDPELARYLNKDYWLQRKCEQKAFDDDAEISSNGFDRRKTPTPTAPPPSESSHSRGATLPEANESLCSVVAPSVASTLKQLDTDPNPTPNFPLPEDEQTAETMEFCRQLKEQVTVMDNRIRSNIARNRLIVNDSAIQSLFVRLTEMHAQVMARMNKLEDQRNYFESLQDHLAHIQEARQAVTALREDHERKRQERALEEQRIRQLQMQQKVDLMRQKKHESLLHQRHLALLRFQQQEQEMQMRRMQAQQVAVQPVNYYGMQPQAPQVQQVQYAQVDGTASLPVTSTSEAVSAYPVQGSTYQAQQYGYSGMDYTTTSVSQVPHPTPPVDQIAQSGGVSLSVQSVHSTPVPAPSTIVQSYSNPEFNSGSVAPNTASEHMYMGAQQQYPYQLAQGCQVTPALAGQSQAVVPNVDVPRSLAPAVFPQQQLPAAQMAIRMSVPAPAEQQQPQQYYAHPTQMPFQANQYSGYQMPAVSQMPVVSQMAAVPQMATAGVSIMGQPIAQPYYHQQQQYQLPNCQYSQEAAVAQDMGAGARPVEQSAAEEALLISFD